MLGRSGMTPLMYASGFGHLEVVHLLCDYGAEINLVDDKYGMTALHQVTKHAW
jgi:ankyrin repeat protein